MKSRKMQIRGLGKKIGLRKVKPIKNTNLTPKKKKRK